MHEKIIEVKSENAKINILITCTKEMIDYEIKAIRKCIESLVFSEAIEKKKIQDVEGENPIKISVDYNGYIGGYVFPIPPFPISHPNLIRMEICREAEKGLETQIQWDLFYSTLETRRY